MSTKNSILKDIKKALIMAHNQGNHNAISKDFAAGCGVSERAYESWVTFIDTLHYKVAPWVEKFNDKDIPDEELQNIYKDIFPTWRLINTTDDKLFIRESDAIVICGYAKKHGRSEVKGSIDVLVGKKAFRREIETELGIRIAQNEVLTEDEYDVIVKYERAEANKEKATQKLEGYERNGQKVMGLKEKLENAKKVLKDMMTLVNVAKGTKTSELAEKYPLLSGYIAEVENLESDITNTETRITKADETIKKLGKQYKDLTVKIELAK